MADTEAQKELMTSSITRYLEGSAPNSSGLRIIPKAVYVEGLAAHGVTEDDVKRVKAAEAFENTAAAGTLIKDIEDKIATSSPEDLKSEDYRRGLEAEVRIPTFGGATTLTMNAEAAVRIPGKPDPDGNSEPKFKISHGRLKTSINTKGQIHKSFHDEASASIRKALGLKD